MPKPKLHFLIQTEDLRFTSICGAIAPCDDFTVEPRLTLSLNKTTCQKCLKVKNELERKLFENGLLPKPLKVDRAKPKPETFYVEITEEELAQIPIKIRRRISRRFMKAARFQAAYDGDL